MSIYTLVKKDPGSKARAGLVATPHGVIETPVFMPVGTQGTVKTTSADDIMQMGYKIMLSNAYHLFLRPGVETLVKAGGLHKFMAWPGAVLTDSGGFQVFSLAQRCKLTEEGAEFQSHVDGSRKKFTPEIATEFQLDIGTDIAMCLDDCPPYPSLKKDAAESMERTLRWARRCQVSHAAWVQKRNTPAESSPLLFGITQGASFPDLRTESAERMVQLGFPGYAVGGLGVGEPKDLMWSLLEASIKPLPEDKPRYMMGIGQPEDMWDGVERGVDMFDCVLPTRNGRNGQGFTSMGRINVPNGGYREDFSPLDPNCECPICRRYTRAYLCHLFRAGELLGPRLVTLHNLWFMIGLLRSIRNAIINGHFQAAKQEFFRRYNGKEATV